MQTIILKTKKELKKDIKKYTLIENSLFFIALIITTLLIIL